MTEPTSIALLEPSNKYYLKPTDAISEETHTNFTNSNIERSRMAMFKLSMPPSVTNIPNHVPTSMEQKDDKLKAIIETENRSEEEALELWEYLRLTPFFEHFTTRYPQTKLENKAFLEICHDLVKYEKHPAKKVLYREGDTPNGKLYILFSGTAYTVKKTDDIVQLDTKNNHTIAKISEVFSDESDSEDHEVHHDHESERSNSIRSGIFTKTGLPDSPQIKRRGSRRDSELSNSSSIAKRHSTYNNDEIIMEENPMPNIRVLQPGRVDHVSHFAAASSIMDINNEAEVNNGTLENLDKYTVPKNTKELSDNIESYSAASPAFANRRKLAQSKGNLDKDGYYHEGDNPPQLNKFELALMNLRKGGVQRKGSIVRMMINKKKTTTSTLESPKINKPRLKEVLNECGTVQTKILKGGFFGERALVHKQVRDHSAVTGTPCEFLVLNKRDFQVIAEKYDMKCKIMREFLSEYMPEFDRSSTREEVDDFLENFEEVTLERDMYITKEGEAGTAFYLLHEGECEITRNARVELNPKNRDHDEMVYKLKLRNATFLKKLPVSKVGRGHIFGEEIVYMNTHCYDLTVKVTSPTARVFVLDKEKFIEKFSPTSYILMKELFRGKRKNYIEKISDLILKQFSNFELKLEKDSPFNNHKDFLNSGMIILTEHVEYNITHTLSRKAMKGRGPNAINNPIIPNSNLSQNGPLAHKSSRPELPLLPEYYLNYDSTDISLSPREHNPHDDYQLKLTKSSTKNLHLIGPETQDIKQKFRPFVRNQSNIPAKTEPCEINYCSSTKASSSPKRKLAPEVKNPTPDKNPECFLYNFAEIKQLMKGKNNTYKPPPPKINTKKPLPLVLGAKFLSSNSSNSGTATPQYFSAKVSPIIPHKESNVSDIAPLSREDSIAQLKSHEIELPKLRLNTINKGLETELLGVNDSGSDKEILSAKKVPRRFQTEACNNSYENSPKPKERFVNPTFDRVLHTMRAKVERRHMELLTSVKVDSDTNKHRRKSKTSPKPGSYTERGMGIYYNVGHVVHDSLKKPEKPIGYVKQDSVSLIAHQLGTKFVKLKRGSGDVGTNFTKPEPLHKHELEGFLGDATERYYLEFQQLEGSTEPVSSYRISPSQSPIENVSNSKDEISVSEQKKVKLPKIAKAKK